MLVGHWADSGIDITDNVELMVSQIQLSPRTQNVLKLAAVWGQILRHAGMVNENLYQKQQRLWESLQAGLVLPWTRSQFLYQRWAARRINKYSRTATNNCLQVLHDRVQQSFLIPDSWKKNSSKNRSTVTTFEERKENIFGQPTDYGTDFTLESERI